MAADIAAIHCTPLSSPELEALLLNIASQLTTAPFETAATTQKHPTKKRLLHVVTYALPSGGHTAMMRRWIELDHSARHSVVTLEQKAPVPFSLAGAVAKTDGDVIQLNPAAALTSRALSLRRLAQEGADIVILHVHPQDVIATVAFGVTQVPPVWFINHGAHKFWVGVAISDFVLNCRGSHLENEWTVRYRGVAQERSRTLPIPLDYSKPGKPRTERDQKRNSAKKKLGIPDDTTVILTSGDTYKFTPIRNIDFLHIAKRILKDRPDVFLFAVGVDENVAWSAASKQVGGRLQAVGRHASLRIYHDAADIYIEGFPFGSTTALLEAGAQGIPCVLAPGTCPPPFTSDGLALEGLPKPRDLDEYLKQIEAFVESPDERVKKGSKLAAAIERVHTGQGWFSFLEQIKSSVPAIHHIHPVPHVEQVAPAISNFWGAFWHNQHRKDEFLDTYQRALVGGLTPRLDLPVLQALAASRDIIKRNVFFNIMTKLACSFAYLFPKATTSRFWCHNLFFYLRDDGFIMRQIQALSLRFRPSKEHEPAK
ncbi:glycosyltransferase family 4 protein [Geomesophilobacter sediminis]|uniref:Glycosyltransferase family 4 protein n=1 Tax=Geomesophilobacter sediminis TaxID=2798584 RepID=A0A8J7M206_9BACT|nr:glycosyltransferase family 4 protein [Geomesophilobacter sediminis]MBJ6727093.1 glycosyltransferase family 4 protein [Geomesophilobacter sediminis]